MKPEGGGPPAGSLVWIDSREALIVLIRDDRATVERVESEVPAHRRSTGHVRHDPAIRHGGGGSPQSAGEPHRIEHLKRFVHGIANRVPADAHVLILGPGTVREQLARQVAASDANARRDRTIVCEASPPLTPRQLIALLLRFSGIEPRKRIVGAHRWSPSRTRRHRPGTPMRRQAAKPLASAHSRGGGAR